LCVNNEEGVLAWVDIDRQCLYFSLDNLSDCWCFDYPYPASESIFLDKTSIYY